MVGGNNRTSLGLLRLFGLRVGALVANCIHKLSNRRLGDLGKVDRDLARGRVSVMAYVDLGILHAIY